MRAFVQMTTTWRTRSHENFNVVFSAIKKLTDPPAVPGKKRIVIELPRSKRRPSHRTNLG